MTKPQQPELRRTGLGGTDQDAAELRAGLDELPESRGRSGPVPEHNRPGHHPAVEQDKPSAPPA